MANVLSEEKRQQVTALGRLGWSLRRIESRTGLRRAEVVKLLVSDVDFAGGTVMVREGKGKKDRLVPVGERAVAWVQKYLDEARPRLSLGRDEGHLFLEVTTGGGMGDEYLTHLVHRYVEGAVGKAGSCHLFRHACATHMLEGGADVRFVQAMLGHTDLSSTQLYTHVAISKLKAVHAQTHPAAQLSGKKASASAAELLQELEDTLAREEEH